MTSTVELLDGAGGLPMLRLTAADGARAEIYLHGAHVTSWVPASGDEQLFLSARSAFRAGTAIRGGIPVIFPQFGGGPLPKHGFARTARWEVVHTAPAAGARARATLALRDSDALRAIWPHPFVAELTVAVAGPTLTVSLGVENPGTAPVSFTGALHTYLRVGDVGLATVAGLAGVRYRDQAAGGSERTDEGATLAFDGEVDRVYIDAPPALALRDASVAPPRVVEVRAHGFPDAVLWNPGAEKARTLDDLGAEGYRHMVCVEAAVAARPVSLRPGARWDGAQQLTAR
jgi:glucose-6-phosphate 1-epimerase